MSNKKTFRCKGSNLVRIEWRQIIQNKCQIRISTAALHTIKYAPYEYLLYTFRPTQEVGTWWVLKVCVYTVDMFQCVCVQFQYLAYSRYITPLLDVQCQPKRRQYKVRGIQIYIARNTDGTANNEKIHSLCVKPHNNNA